MTWAERERRADLAAELEPVPASYKFMVVGLDLRPGDIVHRSTQQQGGYITRDGKYVDPRIYGPRKKSK